MITGVPWGIVSLPNTHTHTHTSTHTAPPLPTPPPFNLPRRSSHTQTCLTQCIWKQLQTLSHDTNSLFEKAKTSSKPWTPALRVSMLFLFPIFHPGLQWASLAPAVFHKKPPPKVSTFSLMPRRCFQSAITFTCTVDTNPVVLGWTTLRHQCPLRCHNKCVFNKTLEHALSL